MVGKGHLDALVVARDTQGQFIAMGRFISYCDSPSATIECTDGRRVNWRADMCTAIDLPEDVLAAVMEALTWRSSAGGNLQQTDWASVDIHPKLGVST